MKRMTTVALAIFTVVAGSNLGLAQVQKAAPQTAKTETATKEKSLHRGSPELTPAFADKQFLDECAILATNGEMFLVDSALMSSAGNQFAITFKVVNEKSGAPGQYKQLVYAFDGKSASAYFNQRNEAFKPPKSTASRAGKWKWPPSWWPGSGIGYSDQGGGNDWDDWHEVSIDNCEFSFICPFFHYGKMRREERAAKTNPTLKQTRYILLSCGC